MILVLFSFTALAEEIPAYMRDGEIVVTLKNGKVYKYSTNEWKVVRRGTSPKAKPIEDAPKKEMAKEDAPNALKNRFRLLGGYGLTGRLQTVKDANSVEVSNKFGAVGGIGYDRLLTKKISAGATLLNNETYLLNIGLDY